MKHKTNVKKRINNRYKICFVLSILCFMFIVDRATKLFFLKSSDAVRDFLFFKLNFTLNKNIAFGLTLPKTVIIISIFIILLILFYLLAKNYKRYISDYKIKQLTDSNINLWSIFFLSLIIIGAISNLLDRLNFGGVIDFIDIPHFTVFNLADVYITLGITMWLLSENKKTKNRNC